MNLDAFKNAMQLSLLAYEAQSVVTMRVLGMAGLWSVAPSENERMITEKLTAFTASAQRSSEALLRGEGPDAVLAAAVKPLRKVTKANSKRLAKRGPNLTGQF